MNNRLEEIRDQLKAGKDAPDVSLNEFLRWFGAKRRGFLIVRHIREQLGKLGLITEPDFEDVWWGGSISFYLRDQENSESADVDAGSFELIDELDADKNIWVSKEAAYKISRLTSANKDVVTARNDESIQSVVTKLMKGGYSQIPIVSGKSSIRGVVSWQSIGSHYALGKTGNIAGDFIEEHHEISNDRSVFEAIPIIVNHDYVLVLDSADKSIPVYPLDARCLKVTGASSY